MRIHYFILILFFFTATSEKIYSQLGFSHEVGVITGPVSFYSDFGQRNDSETNLGNIGFGVGIVHYLNFAYRSDCNCYTRDKFFNDHFKVRTELSYHKTNFEHYGKWVDPSRVSVFADQLRAMKGSSTVIDLGAQIEFYPLSIRDFLGGRYRFAPFLSLGFHWVNFDPEVYSELGPMGSPLTTPDKYLNGFSNDSDSTWSVVWSTGVRYKLTRMSDLMLDARWQYYFSNWVDGLNPDVPENKANDWIFWLNVGYIYYID